MSKRPFRSLEECFGDLPDPECKEAVTINWPIEKPRDVRPLKRRSTPKKQTKDKEPGT